MRVPSLEDFYPRPPPRPPLTSESLRGAPTLGGHILAWGPPVSVKGVLRPLASACTLQKWALSPRYRGVVRRSRWKSGQAPSTVPGTLETWVKSLPDPSRARAAWVWGNQSEGRGSSPLAGVCLGKAAQGSPVTAVGSLCRVRPEASEVALGDLLRVTSFASIPSGNWKGLVNSTKERGDWSQAWRI